MSIQDSGSGGVSYSDHDVHHIRHTLNVEPGTGGITTTVDDIRQFEITERGLDPDELAELRAMRVSVGCRVRSGQPQSQRGELSFQVGAGFNLSGNEFLAIADNDVEEFIDPDGDGTDEIKARTTDTDEVGQIYHMTDSYSVGFDDDTNGNGGPTNSAPHAEVLDMNELFGSGPYVDAADDFSSLVQFRPSNVIERLACEIKYSLYYDVSEVEGGRTRFGR